MAAPQPEVGRGSPLPGRCAYFVQRKNRFCKMIPAPGRRFCGEHGQQEKENDRKRIPCPLDPKHTVYEDQLQKHLKKCNSREKPKPVYFVQDINAGLKDVADIAEEQVPISFLSKEELENLIAKLQKASNGLELGLKEQVLSHQALQEALNDPKNGESAVKHLKQQASILGNMEKLHLLGPGRCFVEFGAGRGKLSYWVDVALQNVENVQFLLVERATTRFKVWKDDCLRSMLCQQQIYLKKVQVYNVGNVQLLTGIKSGIDTWSKVTMTSGQPYIVTERSQDVDGKHKRKDSVFERLQVDIQHLCLKKVPILEKKKLPVVGIGKHLCGAATDLALRCLVESYTACCHGANEEPAPKRSRSDKAEVASNNSSDKKCSKDDCKPVAGIVIALCCHHKCDWTHYVGREFFKSVGLGPVEFHYFQRMSSWATCGMRETTTKASTSEESEDQTNDPEEHDQTFSKTESGSDTLQGILTVEERKQIGYLCKLLIDHGRVEYLQQRGYKAALQYYTESAVSLENVLLTAVPGSSLKPEPAT